MKKNNKNLSEKKSTKTPLNADEVPELTIEQERESARESFWKDDDINNKVIHESDDENELNSDDARDAAFEATRAEDEIEKYKP
jgi:hypothetical protein